MRTSLIAILAAAASMVSAQAVTAILKPTAANPAGCATTVPTPFGLYRTEITSSSKRGIERRTDDTAVSKAEAQSALRMNLTNSQLTDSMGRTGAIVANYQFQFDGPPQAGTIYTAGFCILGNGSLVLGNSAVWWSCNSGGFDNLYDRHWAEQCRPILLQTINLDTGSSSSSASGNAAVASTGSAAAVVASASSTPASSRASSSGFVTSASTAASGSATSGSSSRLGSTLESSSATSGTHSSGTSVVSPTGGSAAAASTAPAPTASTSKAAAPTGFQIPSMAIAAGIIGVALL